MKAQISLFALVDSTIVEANTNKLSLVGFFTFYKFTSFPATVPQFSIVTRIINVQPNSNISISINNIESRGGILAPEIEYNNVTVGQDNSVNITTYISGITVDSVGKYPIKIFVNGEELEATPEQYLNIIHG